MRLRQRVSSRFQDFRPALASTAHVSGPRAWRSRAFESRGAFLVRPALNRAPDGTPFTTTTSPILTCDRPVGRFDDFGVGRWNSAGLRIFGFRALGLSLWFEAFGSWVAGFLRFLTSVDGHILWFVVLGAPADKSQTEERPRLSKPPWRTSLAMHRPPYTYSCQALKLIPHHYTHTQCYVMLRSPSPTTGSGAPLRNSRAKRAYLQGEDRSPHALNPKTQASRWQQGKSQAGALEPFACSAPGLPGTGLKVYRGTLAHPRKASNSASAESLNIGTARGVGSYCRTSEIRCSCTARMTAQFKHPVTPLMSRVANYPQQ